MPAKVANIGDSFIMEPVHYGMGQRRLSIAAGNFPQAKRKPATGGFPPGDFRRLKPLADLNAPH